MNVWPALKQTHNKLYEFLTVHCMGGETISLIYRGESTASSISVFKQIQAVIRKKLINYILYQHCLTVFRFVERNEAFNAWLFGHQLCEEIFEK